jgi:hypothetical protein
MFLTSPTLASPRFFAAAARHLSFKRAAIELHVTQGAVSQRIKRRRRQSELDVRTVRDVRHASRRSTSSCSSSCCPAAAMTRSRTIARRYR